MRGRKTGKIIIKSDEDIHRRLKMIVLLLVEPGHVPRNGGCLAHVCASDGQRKEACQVYVAKYTWLTTTVRGTGVYFLGGRIQ